MSGQNWNESLLWKAIESRRGEHADDCRTTLKRLMPTIQTVLRSGGTAPKDFTLHDEGHSFRVAERMAEIVGPEVLAGLSDFEVTLLLLSAYLHDVGMTPEFSKVEGHYHYLLTGEQQYLSKAEADELQVWMDDEQYQVNLPISSELPLVERLGLAQEITTYYCRHKHNDWSGEWIKKQLAGERMGNYVGWVDDLILVCQSHHYGYEKLANGRFKARYVGTPAVVMHPRYLALVLRMADILEFDPERTPEVLLRHRDVAGSSLVYWWKDQAIAFRMGAGKMVLSARPRVALIHRAIEEMVDGIDTELALCRRILDEFPLGDRFSEAEDAVYGWQLPVTVDRDLEPLDGAYEYIDGAFRPDTKKLLKLLSGTQLYESPLDAIRELIQNAFDAVAERIAYQKLEQPEPADPSLAEQLARQHRVALTLEMDGADAYLVCTDTGIGMTKAIIRDRVLVSGSGARHDVRSLERRCKEKGIRLGRSGQFGIGILSYFMVANRVEVETLRAQEAGDSDGTAWQFETAGVGSFGELRKGTRRIAGTRTKLRLNAFISGQAGKFYSDLREYTQKMLVYCPCQFSLSAAIGGCERLEVKPGWAPRDSAGIAFRILLRDRTNPDEEKLRLLASADREKWFAEQSALAEVEKEFRSAVRWRHVEGELPDGSAQYALDVPYFELDGGNCFAFLRVRRTEEGGIRLFRMAGVTTIILEGMVERAWKGMVLKPDEKTTAWNSTRGAYVRINWISDAAGKVMANRHGLAEEHTKSREAEIEERLHAVYVQLSDEFADSAYAWLNLRVTGAYPKKIPPPLWLRRNSSQTDLSGSEESGWSEVPFPSLGDYSYEYAGAQFLLGEGSIHAVPALLGPLEHQRTTWIWGDFPPDRIVSFDFGTDGRFRAGPIYLTAPVARDSRPWRMAEFPPQWRELCGVSVAGPMYNHNSYRVWNADHPLIQALTHMAYRRCRDLFARSVDPLPHREEILSDRAMAAGWLLSCFSREANELWDGLHERDADFLPEVFRLLLPAKLPVLLCGSRYTDQTIYLIDERRWGEIGFLLKDVREYLPEAETGWRVRRVNAERD